MENNFEMIQELLRTKLNIRQDLTSSRMMELLK